MKRVLCVDDDPFMLELYAMAIPSTLAEVELVESAEDAMAHVEGIAAIVLDVGLPGMSGADFLQWVRERSEVPVLVVTGEEKAEHVRVLKELGATDVRSKPIPLGDLRGWVELNAR